MKRTTRPSLSFLSCACVSALSLALLSGCQQSSNRANTPEASSAATARMANAAAPEAAIPSPTGHFDYYLFTLSWAPEYCYGHPHSPECNGSHQGSQRGFVVHGLWPQFQDGHWPSQCSNAPGLPNPSIMLDIMPDPRLIAHEWATHGTCTGLTAAQYFHLVRRAYTSIKIPSALANPSHPTRKSAAEIKQLFTNSNLGMTPEGIAISCHNRYLAGVEFCLGKTLQPITCQAIRDCNQTSITIPSGGR